MQPFCCGFSGDRRLAEELGARRGRMGVVWRRFFVHTLGAANR